MGGKVSNSNKCDHVTYAIDTISSHSKCRSAKCRGTSLASILLVRLAVINELYFLILDILVQGGLTEGEGSAWLTTLYKLAPFDNENIYTFFYKTSYLNEEVNCTEPSHSVNR